MIKIVVDHKTKLWLGTLFCRHNWLIQQHNLKITDEDNTEIVLCWKQCAKCAKSKLVHILI